MAQEEVGDDKIAVELELLTGRNNLSGGARGHALKGAGFAIGVLWRELR